MRRFFQLGGLAVIATVAFTLVQDAEWQLLSEPWAVAGGDTTASVRPFAARGAGPVPVLAELLPLSDEQRNLVHARVMRVADAPVAAATRSCNTSVGGIARPAGGRGRRNPAAARL
jgi:hypothetical protein